MQKANNLSSFFSPTEGSTWRVARRSRACLEEAKQGVASSSLKDGAARPPVQGERKPPWEKPSGVMTPGEEKEVPAKLQGDFL